MFITMDVVNQIKKPQGNSNNMDKNRLHYTIHARTPMVKGNKPSRYTHNHERDQQEFYMDCHYGESTRL